MTQPTAGDLLRDAIARLTSAGIPGAARDARALVAQACGLPRDRLTLHLDEAAGGASEALPPLLAARIAGVPVSRLVGWREFFGRRFEITADVLDPRPETEVLVVAALDQAFARVLDLGTGTGCILVTLLAERGHATGLGTDISDAALRVARRNAKALGTSARGTFIRSDWCAEVDGVFDLIVSNPPYIAEDEMAGLSREVVGHDPRLALTPGGDGLDAYRAICAGAGRLLEPGGRILEIGPTQASAVAALCVAGGLTDPVILPDFDGRDRVVGAKKPGGQAK